MTPFFTVIIPVFNRARELAAALGSVLAQTEQNLEIVVVDDGSNDDPETVVRSFNDPRIRLIRQDNRGGGAARNTGIDAARGAFIALLDSDDVFLPSHLGEMRALLEGTAMQAGYARIVVDRGVGRTFTKPPRAIAEGEDMAEYLLCDRGFVPTSTMVVPAELARRVRFPQDLREAEDTDFAIRVAKAGCRWVMSDSPGTVWNDRFDPNRQSAGRSTERLAHWLEEMRPQMSRKAYLGGRGWAAAKGEFVRNPWRALSDYARAVMHGCYRPSLAAIVLLQIVLPNWLYRAVADGAIAWLRAGLDAPRAAAPQRQMRPRNA